MKRKSAFFMVLALLLPSLALSQEIGSAEKFFEALSKSYGGIRDYKADVTITQGKTVLKGKLYYKSPMSLRIDFDDPKGQVIVTDGEKLTIFEPQYRVVLEQTFKKKSAAAIYNAATGQGLSLLKQNYSVAWLSSPSAQPLEEGSREMVMKLKLTLQGAADYRQYVMSVSPKENVIRRMEGTLGSGDKVILDLTNLQINPGLPDSRFQYDPPAYANKIPNFLYTPNE